MEAHVTDTGLPNGPLVAAVHALAGLADGGGARHGPPAPHVPSDAHPPLGGELYFTGGHYAMRPVRVVYPDGTSEVVEAPSSLAFGAKYTCRVALRGGEYSAEIVEGDGGPRTDAETCVWNVLLAEVPEEAASPDASLATGWNGPYARTHVHVGSVVVGGGGGAGADPDDVSTELIATPEGGTPGADEGKLQVKGWKGGAPASGTSLAEDLQATGSAAGAGRVVFREGDGSLSYKSVGSLAPDGVSLDSAGTAGAWELKGWAAAAAQQATLADYLTASAAVPGAVVVRTSGGQLVYVPFGTMGAQPAASLVWKDPD